VYPNGTAALRGASFDVAGASIHGLIGANGAGKSTLIKILSGAFGASGGEMVWQGAQRAWRSPAEALHAGIATIHQHIPLANTLSVIENIFLSTGGRWRHSAQERKAFADLAETVGYDIDPDAIVGELPIGRRQMVSILQAIAANARLLIMDEPTASLSDGEREVVFDTIRRLQSRHQTSILFISHFLDEVLELCEAVTVLRDGTVVLDEKRDAIDEQTLVAAIVGKKSNIYAVKHTSLAEDGRAPLLAVENLNSGDKIHDVSFAVKPGEILGLAGLLGSGRSEILHAIFGSDVHATGTVSMADRPIQRSIRDALAAGLVLVPEDRIGQALILDESISWNLSLPDAERISSLAIFPVHAREEARAARVMSAFSVKAADSSVEVRRLSGGNAQKVALGRALSPGCKVLLLDEPTAGVDIGAKADIRRVIDEIARTGVAVIVVISDFEELLSMCTRIAVVANGRIVAQRRPEETSEHELVALASGLGG
jgi:ribose transport system ATP-binding protein